MQDIKKYLKEETTKRHTAEGAVVLKNTIIKKNMLVEFTKSSRRG